MYSEDHSGPLPLGPLLLALLHFGPLLGLELGLEDGLELHGALEACARPGPDLLLGLGRLRVLREESGDGWAPALLRAAESESAQKEGDAPPRFCFVEVVDVLGLVVVEREDFVPAVQGLGVL